jgi:opacity protein-like surface antigen
MKLFVVGSVFAVALLAVSAGSVRAQDTPFIQFGLRAALIAHSTYDDKNSGDYHNYDAGFGYGAGLVLKHAISDELYFSGEPSLYYRSLYSYKRSDGSTASIDEMALCIPLMANYFVSLDRFPTYLYGGLELDVPLKTQYVVNVSNGVDLDGRSAVDVGFLIGIGCMVIENLGVDARYVIYFNNPRKEYSELLMSYGIGVFLLF